MGSTLSKRKHQDLTKQDQLHVPEQRILEKQQQEEPIKESPLTHLADLLDDLWSCPTDDFRWRLDCYHDLKEYAKKVEKSIQNGVNYGDDHQAILDILRKISSIRDTYGLSAFKRRNGITYVRMTRYDSDDILVCKYN